jgi:hypothetical protein
LYFLKYFLVFFRAFRVTFASFAHLKSDFALQTYKPPKQAK